jgi:tetratricopeptide (TPR) repeat protein
MQNEPEKKEPVVDRWLPYLVVGPAVGVVGIVVYAWHKDSGSVFAIAVLVAGAAFLGGALLGFLFGIPRLLANDAAAAPAAAAGGAPAAPARSPYAPNTNLEQISDWLTKILVGVGLVELGKISKGTKKLVDFLAPALGGPTTGPSFGLAVLFLYAVSGFLIVYLVTRVYLGRAFAQADELTKRIDQVEEAQQQQQRDLSALAFATRQLNAETSDPPIAQEKLDGAVTAASDLVRIQIFNMARQARLQGSSTQKRQVPAVFRALIAADKAESWHRNHGQLGYALYDARDYAEAEAALSTAIERRDRTGNRGFETYEFVRALSRIELDSTMNTAGPSDAQELTEILADLRSAFTASYTRNQIRADKRVQAWLTRNNLTEADLGPANAANPGSES